MNHTATATPTSSSLQTEFERALTEGLHGRFDPVAADLLGQVIAFHPGEDLTPDHLQRLLKDYASAAVAAIVANTNNDTAMHLIRSAAIGSALLADREAVLRWAKEGQTRCQKSGAEWVETAAEWEWMLANPGRFIQYTRELKRFLNQL